MEIDENPTPPTDQEMAGQAPECIEDESEELEDEIDED